jgi:hypothetical protein
MMNPELAERAEAYSRICQISLDLQTPLGYGHDGTVWKSSRHTAVKALLRQQNYRYELTCYQRFSENNIVELYGFAVPQLVGFDDTLQVIEMKIVTPPYILDFAKVWLDEAPDYPEETLQEHYAHVQELFEDRTPQVRKLLSALEGFGIYYQDPKPGNITFADWPPASK